MERIICFCHSLSREDIERDMLEHGRSVLMEYIIAESGKGNCDCTRKNPKGR